VAAFTGRVTDLRAQGPIVSVSIGVTEAASTALTNAGQPVPQPVTVTAMVDTGASGSVITRGVAQWQTAPILRGGGGGGGGGGPAVSHVHVYLDGQEIWDNQQKHTFDYNTLNSGGRTGNWAPS
jgi:hypothetical protein